MISLLWIATWWRRHHPYRYPVIDVQFNWSETRVLPSEMVEPVSNFLEQSKRLMRAMGLLDD